MARIPRVVDPNGPHRKDITIIQYYDERALLPSVYVDVSQTIQKINKSLSAMLIPMVGPALWKE